MPEPFSVSAASALVAQAAKAVPPIVSGGKPKPERRAEAYIRFQTATVDAVVWTESTGPLQEAGPTLSRNLLAAAVLAGPSLLMFPCQKQRRDWSGVATAMAAPTILAAAVPMLDALAHKYVIVRESSSMWKGLGELLSALYEVRLVGNLRTRTSAEEVVALIGDLLAAMPVRHPSLFPKKPDDTRYLDCQRAVTDALRRFTEAAQVDLRARSRRRDRKRRWQVWRPKPMTIVDVDVAGLISAAARERRDANEEPVR